MNVTCEHCGRSYVLDESGLPEVGLVLGCTGCGHAFRVRRRSAPSAQPPAPGPAGSPSPHWLIRQRDGHVIAFQELPTLQRWISEGRVGRDDEISRSGGVWRRLGDIPEFTGFFEPPPDVDPFRTTDPFEPSPIGRPPEAPAALPVGENRPERPPTDPFRPSPLTAAPAAVAPKVDSGVKTVPFLPAGPAWEEPASAPVEEEPSWKRISVAREIDDEAPEWPRRKGRRWPAVLAVALILVASAAGLTYRFQRPLWDRLFGGRPRPGATGQAGDARGALPSVRREDLAAAEAAFLRALRERPRDGRLLAALADVYATWADYLGEVGDAAGARHKATLALRRADEAGSVARGDPEVAVVRANALRVSGRTDEAARVLGPSQGSLATFVRGSLAATDPNRWEEAERLLREALAQDGSLLRAHVRLARLAQEKRDYAAARRHLEAVLAAMPDHPFARRILRNVPAAPASPTPAPPSAPAAAGEPAAEPDEPAAAGEPAAEPDEPEPPPSTKKVDTRSLLRQANRIRETDPRKAIRLYDRVLARGPSGPAHRGKGWALLEMGRVKSALSEFRAALARGVRGDVYVGLGTAYRRLGDRVRARRFFERYLREHPDGEEAPTARTHLESLK